jgi:hypothetical protein
MQPLDRDAWGGVGGEEVFIVLRRFSMGQGTSFWKNRPHFRRLE